MLIVMLSVNMMVHWRHILHSTQSNSYSAMRLTFYFQSASLVMIQSLTSLTTKFRKPYSSINSNETA